MSLFSTRTRRASVLDRRTYAAMAAAACLSTLMALHITQFVSLQAPLSYDGDTLLVWLIVKTLGTHSWAFYNTAMGLPTTMELNHFPMSFVGQLGVLKAFLCLGLTPIAAINFYFLATFVLTAATSTAVMRALGVQPLWAATGALVYTLLPYHFLRMPHHLFLAGYYMVPVGIYVLLRLDQPDAPTPHATRLYMALCMAATLFNDIYYTFFLAYLIGVTGLFQGLARRRLQACVPSLKILGVMLITAALSFVPALWALYRPGAEPSPLVRPANDSEHYGLKLIQLLLPVPGHRDAWLRRITDKYLSSAPLINENQTTSLGLVGALCLIGVIGYGLMVLFSDRNHGAVGRPVERSRSGARDNAGSATASCASPVRVERLALMIALCFVFGTVGGLSAVLSYSFVTFIRCGNRIAIFIAFFAITGGMLGLQHTFATSARRQHWQALLALCCVGMVMIDTCDVDYFGDRDIAAQSHHEDTTFFGQLEQTLPKGAAIFELPFVTFIEGGYQALDYMQALPYLHTERLRYSFGAFRWTPGDKRNRQTARLFDEGRGQDARAQVRRDGFDAVLLNRALPHKQSERMLRSLFDAFGPPALTSPNKQYLLFVPQSAPNL